jgi:hypothetical protein
LLLEIVIHNIVILGCAPPCARTPQAAASRSAWKRTLKVGDSAYIPRGTVHRNENKTDKLARAIELNVLDKDQPALNRSPPKPRRRRPTCSRISVPHRAATHRRDRLHGWVAASTSLIQR